MHVNCYHSLQNYFFSNLCTLILEPYLDDSLRKSRFLSEFFTWLKFSLIIIILYLNKTNNIPSDMVFETVQSTVEIALVVQRSELYEVVACVSSVKMRLFWFFFNFFELSWKQSFDFDKSWFGSSSAKVLKWLLWLSMV